MPLSGFSLRELNVNGFGTVYAELWEEGWEVLPDPRPCHAVGAYPAARTEGRIIASLSSSGEEVIWAFEGPDDLVNDSGRTGELSENAAGHRRD